MYIISLSIHNDPELFPKTSRRARGPKHAALPSDGVIVARPDRAVGLSRRRQAESRGRIAETDVAAWWAAAGFSILAQRLRTGCGEIDLIVADTDTLIFIEVKARPTLAAAAYAVSPRQQARLLEAAGYALAQHPQWERPAMRFDVALVSPGGIEHIEDAIRYQ